MADRLGYNPGNFVNGQAPAIDATLMNAIKNALNTNTFDADFLNAIAGNRFWYASSGTGGSDGNGGQPPAPKPRSATDSDIGQFKRLVGGTGADCVLPSGGTWAWCVTTITSPSTYFQMAAGVNAGGSIVVAAIAGKFNDGFCWRVA